MQRERALKREQAAKQLEEPKDEKEEEA